MTGELKPQGSDPTQAARVRAYYDRNTQAFTGLGQGRNVGAIHRAVWGGGASTRDAAMRFVEVTLWDYWRRSGSAERPAGTFVDLGCGVCSSLCFLAELGRDAECRVDGVGVTISPVQAQLGQEHIRRCGFEQQLEARVGDFCALPDDLANRADVAFAIESFVHAESATRFLTQAARVVKPGGVLFVCDDMLTKPAEQLPARARPVIDRFRRGWRICSLLDESDLRSEADTAGFDHLKTWDLTPFLELGRPRDHFIRWLVKAVGWSALLWSYMDMLRGGDALQQALRHDWIRYKLVALQRRST